MLIIVSGSPALLLLLLLSSYSLYCENGWLGGPPKHSRLLSLIVLIPKVNISSVFFLIWPSFLTTLSAPVKHSSLLALCLGSPCLPHTPFFFIHYPFFKTHLKCQLLREAFSNVTSYKKSLPSSEPMTLFMALPSCGTHPYLSRSVQMNEMTDEWTCEFMGGWVGGCTDGCMDGMCMSC